MATTIFLVNPREGAVTPPSYLLDTYSATAAYSLRQLKTGVTSVVRVRRSSDNREANFTPTEITDGTLTGFCGGGDGFVVTLYDQSGNGNDATRSSASNQPRLVSAGTLDTEPTNGLPAMWLDGDVTNHYLNFASTIAATQELYHTMVFTRTSGKFNGIIRDLGGNTSFYWYLSNTIYSGLGSGLVLHDSGQTQTGTQLVTILRDSSSNVKYWLNNVAGTTKTHAFLAINFDRLFQTGGNFYGHCQEVILFNTDQESNRTAIESDINGHYSIY